VSGSKYGRRHRILIVEDDASCAAMYQRALRFAGFDVDLAADGLSALRILEDYHPDLIVLDLHLPRLQGESVLSEVAARPELNHIPVVVVTGSDARVAAAQASAILSKPCDPDRLVNLIQDRLDSAA
jgi:two-component system response regulator ResD